MSHLSHKVVYLTAGSRRVAIKKLTGK